MWESVGTDRAGICRRVCCRCAGYGACSGWPGHTVSSTVGWKHRLQRRGGCALCSRACICMEMEENRLSLRLRHRQMRVSPDGWNIPARPGKVFDGWYLDAGCTAPFTGVEERISVLELYAGWREFEGFVSDDVGQIDFLHRCWGDHRRHSGTAMGTLPCAGIEAGAAFVTAAGQSREIYIPADGGYHRCRSF